MPSNYYAPAFEVKINGSKLSEDVSRYISRISVTKELDKFDQCSLTLANPGPDMRWTKKDVDLFKLGGSMVAKIDYVDNLKEGRSAKSKKMFDGEIIAIAPTFPESGMPTVNIQAYNRLHLLNGSPKSDTYKDTTDKKLVQQIAQEAGLSLSWKEDKPGITYKSIPRKNATDLKFILERAKIAGFEVLVEGKELLFRKPKEANGKNIVLEWGKGLKSFSPRLNTADQVGEVIVKGWDPINKKKYEGRAGSGDEDTKMGGKITGPEFTKKAFGKIKKETVVNEGVGSQEEATQRARAIYNEKLGLFLTGSGACIGNPDIAAGGRIDLQGLGDRFKGIYEITQVTHSISNSGYQTNFDVRRNAING